MPKGDKSKYTDKQKRKAEHIEEGYEKRGVPEGEAKGRVGTKREDLEQVLQVRFPASIPPDLETAIRAQTSRPSLRTYRFSIV